MEHIQTFYESYSECDKALLNKKVKIIHNSVKSYSNYDIVGEIGTIITTRTDTGYPVELNALAIKIPGKHNMRSEKGLFWLKPTDLVILEGETTMYNKLEINEEAKICIVENLVTQDTNFGAYYGNLKEGDLVVCDFNYNNGKVSVRRVIEVEVTKESYVDVVCEILGKVDTTDYDLVKTKAKKRKELKEQMIQRAKIYQEEVYWKSLADMDPVMKDLYEEFKKL